MVLASVPVDPAALARVQANVIPPGKVDRSKRTLFGAVAPAPGPRIYKAGCLVMIMICDDIASWKALKVALPSALGKALAWIEKNKSNPPADATIPLDNGMRVIVQSYEPKDIEGGKFENHRKFIDVQYVVSGAEMIYWSKTKKQLPVTDPYSDEKDIEFVEIKDPVANSTGLRLEAGMFAILWPGDWHLPCIDPAAVHPSAATCVKKGMVKKFVVKVPA